MIVITGVNGFVGKHLARELHTRGLEIIGIGNQEPEAHPEISDILDKYIECDIASVEEVSKLDLTNITSVINLAGLANVGASFDNPDLYMRVNVGVLEVLGSELLRQSPSARMIAISSGALYDPNQPMPIDELAKIIESSSPYTQSKVAMEKAGERLREKGLDCVLVRPFNHIGPGQGLGFLIPDLINKLRQADKQSPSIKVGNIKTIRDYTDVRDIVKAYADLAEAKILNHSLYNICSGNGQSGEDILKSICKSLLIDFDSLAIDIDPSLIRPNDPEKIIGNHDRLTADTDWQPRIELDKTIADIISNT